MNITPAEQLVLDKLCQGKTNKIIGYELGISEFTVKVHVQRIMKKTGSSNRVQVVLKTHPSMQESMIWAS